MYQDSHAVVNLGIYVSLAMGSGMLVLVRVIIVALGGVKSTQFMFEAAMRAVLKAPMWWFSQNPVGRILNRFADDQAILDSDLPLAVGSVMSMCFSVLGTFIVTCVVTKWLVLLVVPSAVLYWKFTGYYLTTSREVQRLQQISQSPVLAFVRPSPHPDSTLIFNYVVLYLPN